MTIEPFIKCSDISASLKFYTEILDFKVTQAPDPDPESFMSMYASISREGHCIHLSEHKNDGVFGNVIYVRVDNIDSIYEKFIDNGLIVLTQNERINGINPGVVIEPVEQTWGMKEFAVNDPNGNRMSFGHQIA